MPIYIGVSGNEKADPTAMDLPRAKVGVPYSDLKRVINPYVFASCQGRRCLF